MLEMPFPCSRYDLCLLNCSNSTIVQHTIVQLYSPEQLFFEAETFFFTFTHFYFLLSTLYFIFFLQFLHVVTFLFQRERVSCNPNSPSGINITSLILIIGSRIHPAGGHVWSNWAHIYLCVSFVNLVGQNKQCWVNWGNLEMPPHPPLWWIQLYSNSKKLPHVAMSYGYSIRQTLHQQVRRSAIWIKLFMCPCINMMKC